MRDLLRALVVECPQCFWHLREHVALLVDERGRLTEDQIEAVLVYLLDAHHVH